MHRSRYVLAILACLAVGCSRAPEWYVPPFQEQPLTGSEPPRRLGDFMSMTDPNASDYIVRRDSRQTEFRFRIGQAAHLHVAVDFTIKGPASVEVFVNGALAGKYDGKQPGIFRINEPVAPELLLPGAENRVEVTSDADGVQLSRAGFIE